jgi:hypothetical protein
MKSLIIGALLCASFTVNATLSKEDFSNIPVEQSYMYLGGLISGLTISDSINELKGNPTVFCWSEIEQNALLEPTTLASFMGKYMETHSEVVEAASSIDFVVIAALLDKFSCGTN